MNQKKFNIVFLDPPYNKNYLLETLQEIDKSAILKEGGLVIIQHPANTVLECDYKNIFYLKDRKYGRSKITIFDIDYKNT